MPYLDLDTDYSDSWIANIWSVSKGKEGAVTQTVSDATSIAAYDELAQTITDLPIRLNAEAGDIATAYLAKYKDPLLRANSIALSSGNVDAADAFFNLELAERVRVIRTIPKGLGWFDQVMYVQKMEVSGSNTQESWAMSLHVSPL